MDEELLKFLPVYHVYRTRVVDEYNFINHRMTWFVLSEAMLFSASFVVIANRSVLNDLISIFVVLTGLFVAFFTARSVGAARTEVEHLIKHYGSHYAKIATDPRLPILTGSDGRHELGHYLPIYLPRIIFVVWCVLGLALLLSRTGLNVQGLGFEGPR